MSGAQHVQLDFGQPKPWHRRKTNLGRGVPPDKVAPGAPDDAAAMYRARIPMRRIGDPAECAQAIAWLLSDAASYVTGAVLTVDGGIALGAA